MTDELRHELDDGVEGWAQLEQIVPGLGRDGVNFGPSAAAPTSAS